LWYVWPRGDSAELIMEYTWHDLVGNIGVVMILVTYLLLQMRRLSATGLTYSVANGVGALFVLYSLTQEFNLSAFVMELAWFLVSLYGVREWWRRRRTENTSL
jgi:uncharacterized membrane protein YfcA